MIKTLENMGTWMLGRIVPSVRASAGCPPDPWCAVCGMCHLKRCSQNGACKTFCGSCGYDCSARAGAQAITLC